MEKAVYSEMRARGSTRVEFAVECSVDTKNACDN